MVTRFDLADQEWVLLAPHLPRTGRGGDGAHADCGTSRKDQRRRAGRPPRFESALYRQRHHVENAIGRLKEFRRVTTRYEKLAVNYLAVVDIACLGIFLRELVPSDRA
jgi:transposase